MISLRSFLYIYICMCCLQIIRASDPTEKVEFSYDRDRRTLVIRKPLVSINLPYKIIISF